MPPRWVGVFRDLHRHLHAHSELEAALPAAEEAFVAMSACTLYLNERLRRSQAEASAWQQWRGAKLWFGSV